jgi:hypothetical protein
MKKDKDDEYISTRDGENVGDFFVYGSALF